MAPVTHTVTDECKILSLCFYKYNSSFLVWQLLCGSSGHGAFTFPLLQGLCRAWLRGPCSAPPSSQCLSAYAKVAKLLGELSPGRFCASNCIDPQSGSCILPQDFLSVTVELWGAGSLISPIFPHGTTIINVVFYLFY